MIKKVIKRILAKPVKTKTKTELIEAYKAGGSIPWSDGYHEYKWQQIEKAIHSDETINQFRKQTLPANFGFGIDERVVEYPWLLSNLQVGAGNILDAGSTFNFSEIIGHPVLENKEIYIYTYYPEENNYSKNRISYVYGDLRELPFKTDFFDQVVCQSTIEHIDMDNSMYGYDLEHQANPRVQSYEYLKVIAELVRVVKPGGKLLLTFPYGKFEHHGFFQQFDAEMLQRIEDAIHATCIYKKSFIKYSKQGWQYATQDECVDVMSYNPHTGVGKGEDNAAHCRAICFLEIVKNN